jgi:hypothetical protein
VTRLALRLLGPLLAAGFAACAGGGGSSDTVDPVAQIPFAAGEELTYRLLDADGEPIGHGVLSVEAIEGDGGTLRLVQRYTGVEPEDGGPTPADTSTVTVDATTLRPRSMERVIEGPDGVRRYAGAYSIEGEEARLVATASDEDGDEDAHELELRDHAFENESSLWLWRTLAFAEEYEARYTSVNVVEASQQTAELRMTGQQTITVPAGTFDTWRLQIRNGRATRVAWINVEPPHEIVQWDNGTLLFQLERTSAAP